MLSTREAAAVSSSSAATMSGSSSLQLEKAVCTAEDPVQPKINIKKQNKTKNNKKSYQEDSVLVRAGDTEFNFRGNSQAVLELS